MQFAYIGTLNQGGTCLMRGEMLRKLLPESQSVFIDTNVSFGFFNRPIQSAGFRFKRGPLVPEVNRRVMEQTVQCDQYDFIWVDKAIYLSSETTRFLKSKTKKLIHYTPDTAFFANRSRYFYRNLPLYDYVITTKWFDRDEYLKYMSKEKLIFCTQGYDPYIHKPHYNFQEKKYDLAFIGLCESSREKIIQFLLNNNISVVLAGHGWRNFLKKNKNHPSLHYKGLALQNEDYARTISSCYFSPGLLSKKFQEHHTTRTFEIPACGTALLTERNEETKAFFSEEEAIFYHSPKDMIEKILYYKSHPDELEQLSHKGMQRVRSDGRDYESILRNVLRSAEII